MALSSMTGFARSHGASGPYTFEWELKSVNAKGFDLRLRLPPGWDELEAFAKKRAGEVLSRGTVYANLNVKRANAVSTIRINEDVLNSIVKVAGVLAGKIDAVAPSIDGLLGIKGVIEVVEPESNEEEDKAAKDGRGRSLRAGAGQSGRDAPPRGRHARADPEPAHGRDREAGEEGRGRARPQARSDQGAAGRADRGTCWKPPIASIPTGSIRKRS